MGMSMSKYMLLAVAVILWATASVQGQSIEQFRKDRIAAIGNSRLFTMNCADVGCTTVKLVYFSEPEVTGGWVKQVTQDLLGSVYQPANRVYAIMYENGFRFIEVRTPATSVRLTLGPGNTLR